MKDNIEAQEYTADLTPKAERLLKEISQPVLDSFTPEQKSAVVNALGLNRWRQHPIDIRRTLPFPGGPYYIALVMGREGRNPERLEQMRDKHPFYTVANTVFSIVFAFVFTVGMTSIGLGILFAIGRITL